MYIQDKIKEYLSYDEATGAFAWIASRGRVKPGKIAGIVRPDGYVQIRIDGKCIRAHRLAWFFTHGAWPESDIDHINGIRDDNRICNLRAVTKSENQQNQRVPKRHNKLGFLGVITYGSTYAAVIRKDGKQVRLGRFETPELAHQAYLTAKREMHTGCTI